MRGLRLWLTLIVMGLFLQGCRESAPHQQSGRGDSLKIIRNAVPLTSGKPALRNPTWAPRGSRVAASSADGRSLWILDVDSSSLSQIASGHSIGRFFVWCLDGRCLAYREASPQGRRRLWVIRILDLNTSKSYVGFGPAARVSPPRWDPASSTLYFSERNQPRLFHLSSADTGLGIQRLSLHAWLQNAGAGTLVFERNGGLDVYTAGRKNPVRCSLAGEAQILNPAVSPNGKQLAFESTSGDSLFVLDLVTGRLESLGVGHLPVWSPLGDYLACEIQTEDGLRVLNADLVLVDTRSGRRLMLTRTPEKQEGHPSWAPDGEKLVYHEVRDGKLYLAEFAHVYETPPER